MRHLFHENIRGTLYHDLPSLEIRGEPPIYYLLFDIVGGIPRNNRLYARANQSPGPDSLNGKMQIDE
jgi:hypothetical protein